MGRRQAANGASNKNSSHRSTLASSGSTSTPPIFQLPTDVWLYIFGNLPPQALAALSAACKRLLRLVDEHGWKGVLALRYATVSLNRVESSYREYTKQPSHRTAIVRSKWWFAYRYASLLDDCWADVTLRTGSVEIHAGDRKRVGRERGRKEGFAIPTLALGSQWLVVGARSELLVYSANLSNQQGTLVARIKLNSRMQNEKDASTGASTSTRTKGTNGVAADNPWEDITALETVNAEASLLAVGFANGLMQIVALKEREGKDKAVTAEVMHHFGSQRRQEVVGLSICNGGGTGSAPASTGTSAGTSQTELWIASLSKRGCLRIYINPSHQDDTTQTRSYQIDSEGTATPLTTDTAPDDNSGTNTSRTNFRSAAFNNAPLVSPHDPSTPPTRAWSVLLGNSVDRRHDPRTEDQRWVAVGMTAEHAVYVYPSSHDHEGVRLQEPFYVASTGQRTSAYAFATPPAHSTLPSFLLFVGFYDGVVRVYDTRQIHSTLDPDDRSMAMDDLSEALNATPRRRRRVKRELDPIAVYREEYDTDAIYSLSFGGTQADRLVVGGARHAKVRVFDVSDLAGYHVPLLSAPVGREKGRRRVDWTAFALASTDTPQYQLVAGAERVVGVTDRRLWWFDFGLPLLGAERKDEQGVAYFRHRDGLLSYSNGHYQHR